MNANTQPSLSEIVQAAGPRRSSKLRYLIIAILIIIVLAGGLIWSRAHNGAQHGPTFSTTPLTRGDIHLTITATGNLEPTNEVTVGSEVSGTILAVYVDTNDRVTKGQELAQIDKTQFQQEIDSSRATVNVAKAAVAQAQATVTETAATLVRYNELRSLSGGKLPSQADYDTATAASERAKANLLSAEAAAAQAAAALSIKETNLTKTIIKSPMDGIVLTRDIEPGQTVQASYSAPELFVIAEKLEHMKLVVAVAEADIGRLEEGQTATFTVDAWPNRSYSAKVLKVAYGSEVTNNVVTYETELQVANSDLSLRPGMTATADIRVAEAQQVFLVPTAALRFDPASSLGASASGDTQQKKSFIQSLTPMPPRRQSGRSTGEQPATVKAGESHIWILRDGHPESIAVKVGITDGRMTEISGDDLTENLEVITGATASATP